MTKHTTEATLSKLHSQLNADDAKLVILILTS